MKKPTLSYRGKLYFSNIVIVLIIVVSITLIMTATASHQAQESNYAALDLLTEQALMSFDAGLSSTAQSLFSASNSSAVPQKMFSLRKIDPATPGYFLAKQELVNILGYTVTGSSPFDAVSVCMDTDESLVIGSREESAKREMEELFAIPGMRENTHGRVRWVRLPDRSVWLVRDIYNTSPLRHMGKCAARAKKSALINLNTDKGNLQYNVVFFSADGTYLTAADENMIRDPDALYSLLSDFPEEIRMDKVRYAASVHQRNGWYAVGLQPLSVVKEVQYALWRSAAVVGLLGLVFGLGLSLFLSRRLSGQIRDLVAGMNRVAAGDLDAVTPVNSGDEIGQLADHFNRMTQKTKQLMERVVQEEANRRRAKYQNLEYEYRFLQWQINPHFIYNALETVNALAKIDGNDELCEMIVLLSAYFRQNAETMRKRFLTVKKEFRSLRQYVEIYRQIYGETLEVDFRIEEEAGEAYLPTMIVQPLLENALVHGINAAEAPRIEITAEARDGRLIVRIGDNGPGMDEETLRRLLEPATDEGTDSADKTSIGVRNVLQRLHLIYGEAASLQIRSNPGAGTLVIMELPLSHEEWNEPFHLDGASEL